LRSIAESGANKLISDLLLTRLLFFVFSSLGQAAVDVGHCGDECAFVAVAALIAQSGDI